MMRLIVTGGLCAIAGGLLGALLMAVMSMSSAKDEWPRIVATEGTCGGRPRIDGHRIPTENLYDIVAAGDSPEIVAEWFETVSATDVMAAVYFERGRRYGRKEASDAVIQCG